MFTCATSGSQAARRTTSPYTSAWCDSLVTATFSPPAYPSRPVGLDLPADLVEVQPEPVERRRLRRARNASQTACLTRSRFTNPAFGHG